MYAIADIIVQPAITLLQDAITALEGASLVAQRGIADPGQWLGPVTYLGSGWTTAVGSLLAATGLMVALMAAVAVYRLYLALKAGVQWW